MPDDIHNLSIRNALIAWCFAERVDDMQQLETHFLSQDLVVFGWPNLGGASNRGIPVPPTPSSLEEIRYHLDNAWQNLLLDFRQRVTRGELVVRGVQAKPIRGLNAVRLPGQWATDFRIDPLNDVIEIDDERYVNVRISAAAEEATRRLQPDGAAVDASHALLPAPPAMLASASVGRLASVEADVSSPSPPKVSSRRRGRPAMELLVEDDLRENWEHVHRHSRRKRNGEPVWSEVARTMQKRLAKRLAGQAGQRTPTDETIRKHMRTLYPQILGEKNGR